MSSFLKSIKTIAVAEALDAVAFLRTGVENG